ncbi:MAG TPA: site-specific DNA-methyltransferase [Ignavibacteriales bacterium]|nr:site-specific DNA-methyltransferase [Ignavibacteriales bacterium]
MKNLPLPRLDRDLKLQELLAPYCRFSPGQIWTDEQKGHKIACLDAAGDGLAEKLLDNKKSSLAIHDPPYNLVAFEKRPVEEFTDWCAKWITNSELMLSENSSLYVWIGADNSNHFQPLADFIVMMRKFDFRSKNLLTLRNQRGYGTKHNWMAIRQELLYYVKGSPVFNIEFVYTDIPKILNGYYKFINGEKTDNFQRSKSDKIRAGNVWVDIQQVFYRMEENVNGCYAQKPLKSSERIILTSSKEGDVVLDFFAHAGTTLLASEKLNRICYTLDINPIYCEISLRRLERYRKLGKTGWQNSNPFEEEINNDSNLKHYLYEKYSLNLENKKAENIEDDIN